ncbi:MAG: 1-deoxy-D-xylulose-5-phosphate reductoisomerase [Desulfobulbaceae bacterium A2]|nr:MAG: 1-deoxy-D-xylulose-5-phosphate reductoisomerase [Desulfobulbaceae bacterium A2]
MKCLSLLGSTGSIGTNVLAVVRQFPDKYRIGGLAAGRNLALLQQQIIEFSPQCVSVAEREDAVQLAALLPSGFGERIFWGEEGLCRVATLAATDMVVSAVVGAVGLLPTLEAIRAGKDLALANKETLVMAGRLVMHAVAEHGVRLLPVDSEHNAIFQALEAGRREDVHRIILTASGGPFRTLPAADLVQVSPAQALAHPTWSMGRKISIDSATLMNKGLEVIEARWLFDMEVDHIEVLVHPQSVVHSLVEFIDGSVMAQLGIPDMRIPITCALSWPERQPLGLSRLDLTRCGPLHFEPPDLGRFPALGLAYDAVRAGGLMPTVLNAANEVAVEAFLAHRIRYVDIAAVVEDCLARTPAGDDMRLDDILAADAAARCYAREELKKYTGEYSRYGISS